MIAKGMFRLWIFATALLFLFSLWAVGIETSIKATAIISAAVLAIGYGVTWVFRGFQ